MTPNTPFPPNAWDPRPRLTDRQRKILECIRTHIYQDGFAPSPMEIYTALTIALEGMTNAPSKQGQSKP